MKSLFFIAFLYLFCPFAHGEDSPMKNKTDSKTQDNESFTDESLKIKEESKEEKQSEETHESQSVNIESSNKESNAVTKKIKQVFEDFLEILEKESIESSEYTKAVKFLENSLYNEASFDTLKLLATVYKEKKDFTNQIKVLNILSVNYSNNPESFYLLGMAYKHLYSNEEDDKAENKKKSIENFNQAIKINHKYILAYEALLHFLMEENSKTAEKIHTKDSLSVAMDMLKVFRDNKYYIQLCKAYYDNKFLKQSRKACAKSVKKNPKDPLSPLILALSKKNDKEIHKDLLKVAEKFKKSFIVQYKTALFFMDKDPEVAITHFDSAYALQPQNLKLNTIMAKFLFDNKAEKKSYEHFLNACLLTKGKFLKDFRTAKSQLRRKKMTKLIATFQKGIDKCFLSAKKEIKKKTT